MGMRKHRKLIFCLDLHLRETVLPDSDKRCGPILAIVHENDPESISYCFLTTGRENSHSIGIH
jgi:hypothetical protein